MAGAAKDNTEPVVKPSDLRGCSEGESLDGELTAQVIRCATIRNLLPCDERDMSPDGSPRIQLLSRID